MRKWMIYLLMFILMVATWYVNQAEIDLVTAIRGEMPMSWVYRTFHPENFAKNFPDHSRLYHKSLAMHPYLWVYKVFHWAPESFLPFYMAIEVIVMALTAFYLCRTVAPDAPLFVSLLYVTYMLASHAFGTNLARFSPPFFWGLYYSFADGFRMMGLAFFIQYAQNGQTRLVGAASLISLSIMSHVTMGGNALIFVGSAVIGNAQYFFSKAHMKTLAISALVFAVLTGGWLRSHMDASQLELTGSPVQGPLTREIWFGITELASYHWYPVNAGLFTDGHFIIVLPLLSFLILLTLYFRIENNPALRRTFIAGLTGAALVAAFGVLNSHFKWSTTLTKLALHRASDMLAMIGLPFVIQGLWKEITSGSRLRKIAATVVLTSPFLMNPGFPILATGVLTFSHIRSLNWVTRLLVLGTGAYIAGLAFAGFDIPWRSPYYFELRHPALLVGILPIGYMVVAVLLPRLEILHLHLPRFETCIAALLVLAAGLWLKNFYVQRPYAEDRKFAREYQALQLWVRANTPVDALFMPDPSMWYGWRDYAVRSSFGNAPDWLFSGWFYDGNQMVFAEGQRRLAEFDVDVKDYLKIQPRREAGPMLIEQIRKKYYTADRAWFQSLARRYGVEYAVMRKKELQHSPEFPVVFENDSFFVLRLNSR